MASRRATDLATYFPESRHRGKPHCKKKFNDSCPQPGCHLSNSFWPGIIIPRKSLIIDIPAGDGKIANLFLQCGGIMAIW